MKPDPADADWDEERMRKARPREIRLNPDGSRQVDEKSERADAPEGEPKD